MTRTVLRQNWAHAIARSLDAKEGIPAVVRSRAPLKDWSSLRGTPVGRAEDELRYAVQIAPAEYDHELVATCLKRCLQIIEAGEQDERWNTWWSAVRDVEQGRFLSIGEIARAWANDSDLNDQALIRSSMQTVKGVLEQRPVWTELAQCEYVDSVQLLIIAGNRADAAQRLKTPRKFNRVQRYYDWNVRLLDLLNSDVDRAENLSAHFDSYFDAVRHPAFHVQPTEKDGDIVFGVPLLRLRLALIRWIYIERKPIAGNWRHIIGQIGY